MSSRRPPTVSVLRQQLDAKLRELQTLLAPAFEHESLLPASLTTTYVRCGRAGCRCERGEEHLSRRLQIRFADGVVTRSVSADQFEALQPRVDAYKRMRQASRRFRAWHKEVIAILEEIERSRRSDQGLALQDQGRPFK